jgi:hypothetical protein
MIWVEQKFDRRFRVEADNVEAAKARLDEVLSDGSDATENPWSTHFELIYASFTPSGDVVGAGAWGPMDTPASFEVEDPS